MYIYIYIYIHIVNTSTVDSHNFNSQNLKSRVLNPGTIAHVRIASCAEPKHARKRAEAGRVKTWLE